MLFRSKLPDPSTLFLIGALLVMAISWLAYVQDWEVRKELPEQVTREVVAEDGLGVTGCGDEATHLDCVLDTWLALDSAADVDPPRLRGQDRLTNVVGVETTREHHTEPRRQLIEQ